MAEVVVVGNSQDDKENIGRSRKVINKFTEVKNSVSAETIDKGEIIILTKKDEEGAFIKNNNDEIVKISINKTELDNLIKRIVDIENMNTNSSPNQDLTKSEYEELITNNHVTIYRDGKELKINYSDKVYYMIYEDEIFPKIDFSQGDVVLEEDYNSLSPIVFTGGTSTLDLNGKNITVGIYEDDEDNSTNSICFLVKDGELTIKGEGEIVAQDAYYSMAVWANGGTVIISGGTFRNGGVSCDLIYASNGGKVVIYDGVFKATPKGNEPGTGNEYSALNIKDRDRENSSITVYGGRFYEFNPDDNVSEGPKTDFVPEGYKVEVEEKPDGKWYVVKPE